MVTSFRITTLSGYAKRQLRVLSVLYPCRNASSKIKSRESKIKRESSTLSAIISVCLYALWRYICCQRTEAPKNRSKDVMEGWTVSLFTLFAVLCLSE